MRLFWELTRLSFQLHLTYRAAALAGLATNFFFGLLRAAVLVALYGARSEVAGISLAGAITFTGLSQAVIGLLSMFSWYDVMNSIYSGDIASDLLKPMNYFTFWMAQDLGRAVAGLLMRGFTIMAAYAPVFNITVPESGWQWVALCVALVLSWLVSFAWRFLVNLAAFWTPNALGVGRFFFILSWFRWRFVGWGFRQLYTNFAWAYDAVAWAVSRGQWKQWGHAALPRIVGPRVLEIGSGPGHLLISMAAEGYAVSAIDLSPQMVGMAQHRLRRHGVGAGLVRGRAQALPWPDGCFDSVVTTFPAGFILELRTVGEIRRVLRPGGRLIVVDGAQLRGGLYGRLVDLAFRITHGAGGAGEAFGKFMERAGFTVDHEAQQWPHSSVKIIICEKG